MRDNMLVKHYAGSISYGTNIATSDVDFRGLFCADPINIRTPFFTVRECTDVDEEDTKLYELTHFMKLCLDCNPNIIETLWVDRSDLVRSSVGYELLRANRHALLSSKLAFTFSGYAISQLNRIKGHNKWINNPQPVAAPVEADYITMVQSFLPEKIMPRDFNIRARSRDHMLVPYGGHLHGVYPAKGKELVNKDGWLCINDHSDHSVMGVPSFIIKFNHEVYKVAKETHKSYWSWKNNRNAARGDLEEKFGYDCYSDDTEFLTNEGWKLFDEVDESHTLATFNQYSHRVEYQVPTERIDSLYTGNMYHFTGHHTDSLVTANHNMFVRSYSRNKQEEGGWEFARAGELPETFDTLTSISPKQNRQLLPKGFTASILNDIDMLNLLRVIGWYISDGTMQFRDGEVKAMRISQSKPQSKLTQTLNKQRKCNKIDCKHYVYEASGISNYPENIWTFDKKLSTVIYEQCGHGSKTKRIPNWCFHLTKREMTTLLVALLQGDGSTRNHQNHTHVYYTSNEKLADDVQRLGLLCGFETSHYGPYDYNGMNHVHINMRPTTRRTTRDRVEKIPVENKRIVCFMVPNYTLITRRNGQVGFHGNTKHAMHLVRLLRMGVEALRDGEIIVKRPDAQELLDIRRGTWTYKEIVEYATDMDHEVRDVLYHNTPLRKKPDIKFAAQLLMEVQDLTWGS